MVEPFKRFKPFKMISKSNNSLGFKFLLCVLRMLKFSRFLHRSTIWAAVVAHFPIYSSSFVFTSSSDFFRLQTLCLKVFKSLLVSLFFAEKILGSLSGYDLEYVKFGSKLELYKTGIVQIIFDGSQQILRRNNDEFCVQKDHKSCFQNSSRKIALNHCRNVKFIQDKIQ